MQHNYRGKQFRKEFSRLGEIRAFLSTEANIMALTATATKSTRKEICKSLRMIQPALILLLPEKSNIIIKYDINSRDWSEIVWLPEISHFKINLAIGFIRKKPAGMHWLDYNDAVSSENSNINVVPKTIYPLRYGNSFYPSFPFLVLLYSFSKVRISPSKVSIACYGFCLLRHVNKPGLHVI